MSSSTSSSDPATTAGGPKGRPAGRAWLAWLVVLAALVLVEGAVRAIEERLSVDVEHIHQVARIAGDLADEREASGARTVMFLGNSLTRRGLDVGVLESELGTFGLENVAVAAVYPDDTSVLDWLYLYESEIAPAGVPDVVVVGFGIWHLEDRVPSRAQTYRLGRHFTAWSLLPDLFRDDVTVLADRANVLLAKVSATFANRERIARRVLSFLPHYQESARVINEQQRVDVGSRDAAAPRSYDRLARFIRSVEDSGAELVLVAMPILEEFPFDPQIEEVARTNGATLVDARDVPGLGAEHFEDLIHLDPHTGALLYSEHVAELLAPLLNGG